MRVRLTTRRIQSSCTFTKENTAAKPDLNTPEGAGSGRAGRVLRELRQGDGAAARAVRHVHGVPGLQRRSAVQDLPQAEPEAAAEAVRAQPTGEDCPQCGKPLVLRQGAYGEFVSCSGYPKCKYVKQNLIEGMKCPKCGEGDMAERKARRGNIFWGCTNYPKCDFTSNLKPVAKKCPECGSPYLVEKTLRTGIFLECPNKKKGAEEEAPRRRSGRRRVPRRRQRRRKARWCAPIRSASAMRRLRRRPRRMGRWWRRRAEKKELQPA